MNKFFAITLTFFAFAQATAHTAHGESATENVVATVAEPVVEQAIQAAEPAIDQTAQQIKPELVQAEQTIIQTAVQTIVQEVEQGLQVLEAKI